MSDLAFVVPAGIDDPARVSGGNRYDREVRDGLRATGRTVVEIGVPGCWPHPEPDALEVLARFLDALPDDAVVLVDGLVGCAADEVLVPRSGRLRLVVLLHMVVGDVADPRREARVLAVARAVITTSAWTAHRLLERYPVAADRVHVARPGSAPGPVGRPSPAGQRLICVGTLSPVKGQDLLLEALSGVAGLPWRCTLVGPLHRAPDFVAQLRRRVEAVGLGDRVRLLGVRTAAEVHRRYRAADLLVVPSRAESYGMVIGEALSAGVPVLATAVGGIPEALGRTPAGRPGLLVPPGDPPALAAALARWLREPDLRCRLREAALLRRGVLPGWARTVERIALVLGGGRAAWAG